MAPAASLVCTVESTRWPVSEAWIAISAVSRSRISPTMMTSGSWRRNERSPFAKVSSIFGFTCTWPMPRSGISTGSSMVRMLRSGELIFASAAYSVVVLPEPVGPVTSTMPWERVTSPSMILSCHSSKPSSARSRMTFDLSRRRMTIRSP